MNILHLTPYYAPAYAFGGVVRSVEGMARALVRRGHRVTVLTTDALNETTRDTGPAEAVIDGVRVLRVPNVLPWLRGRLNLSTPAGMPSMARTLLPEMDVVHCHEFRTMENWLVTPLAAKMGKPLVLSPHGTLTRATGRSQFKHVWDRLLSPGIAGRFDHVIGLTQHEIAEVKALWPDFGQGASATQFSVIPNGIDPDEYAHLNGRESFRARYGLGDGPVCLFMARLHERKGILVLIEAFKQANVPDSRLVIAGPDEGMLGRIRPLLDERMALTGFLDGADRLAAFAAADMFALPATGEGLPMVVLEAMGAGLPVIVSPGCYLPEVAEAGAGLEVEAQIEPLAEVLRRLLEDADLRAQMGQRGQRLIRDNFAWDIVALKLEQVYQSVLAVVESQDDGR